MLGSCISFRKTVQWGGKIYKVVYQYSSSVRISVRYWKRRSPKKYPHRNWQDKLSRAIALVVGTNRVSMRIGVIPFIKGEDNRVTRYSIILYYYEVRAVRCEVLSYFGFSFRSHFQCFRIVIFSYHIYCCCCWSKLDHFCAIGVIFSLVDMGNLRWKYRKLKSSMMAWYVKLGFQWK